MYGYFTGPLEQQCYLKYSSQLNEINDLIQQFNEQKIATEKIKSLLIMSEFYTNQECNKILSEILKQGVNPNDIFLDKLDFSPLGHAILANNVDAVKILLQHKADPNAICNKLINTTALLHAIKYCKNEESLQIITLLLEHGADPEACNVVSVIDSYLKKENLKKFLSPAKNNPVLYAAIRDAFKYYINAKKGSPDAQLDFNEIVDNLLEEKEQCCVCLNNKYELTNGTKLLTLSKHVGTFICTTCYHHPTIVSCPMCRAETIISCIAYCLRCGKNEEDVILQKFQLENKNSKKFICSSCNQAEDNR